MREEIGRPSWSVLAPRLESLVEFWVFWSWACLHNIRPSGDRSCTSVSGMVCYWGYSVCSLMHLAHWRTFEISTIWNCTNVCSTLSISVGTGDEDPCGSNDAMFFYVLETTEVSENSIIGDRASLPKKGGRTSSPTEEYLLQYIHHGQQTGAIVDLENYDNCCNHRNTMR